MAYLTNNLVGGKVSRTNDVFSNRPASSGYSYYNRRNESDLSSGLRLTFYGENDGDRTYTLTLSPTDVAHVLDTVINANYNIGFFAGGGSTKDRSDHHYEALLKTIGIELSTYRYPAAPFANGEKRWYFVRAVNDRHALFQFSKILKGGMADPSKLERVSDE